MTSEIRRFLLLQFLEGLRDIFVIKVGRILQCLEKFLEVGWGREAWNIMDPRDSSNEEAVGDISQSGQVGLETSFIGDAATRPNKSSNSLIFGILIACAIVSYTLFNAQEMTYD